MVIEFFLIAVVILIGFAVFDLMVGVSNDAANFLNSSLGSKVAPRYIIMIIASLGILAGVTFSSGMMEVARKGIFHPHLFTMPELLIVFLAVMLTDIILLDSFNTFGLPTSTTVSIVFELLGAAVAISVVKIISTDGNLSSLTDYINTAKAMVIILGILLSIVVAFFFGAVVQFISRLIFSFDYAPRLKKYGALWAGGAMASILYFILVKGSKGASFITPETADQIRSNAWTIILYAFIGSSVVFQILLFFKLNILKPLILVGTFALAMAFAANDLVNFIGVPLAGLASYRTAIATDNPLGATMDALSQKVETDTFLLLIAGLIMVITLWVSRKARSVQETELSLGQHEEGTERFEAGEISRFIVRNWLRTARTVKRFIPMAVRRKVGTRMDSSHYMNSVTTMEGQRFDLIRASVNLMVASAVISYATSQKLPLSTTYVTFMVSMGTSFADGAWGRESAVYRITGVLTVIGGWFMTALSAFIVSFLMAAVVYYTKLYAIPVLLVMIGLIIRSNRKRHDRYVTSLKSDKVYNLKKITDATGSVAITFDQMGYLISELRASLSITLDALFKKDLNALRRQTKSVKSVQKWCNIITANIFKSMRLLQKSDKDISYKYAETIRRLQSIADCHRDIVIRAKTHIDNQHKGLIDEQKADLKQIGWYLDDILLDVESTFGKHQAANYTSVWEKDEQLREFAEKLNEQQAYRIVSDASKTRLSILYYAIIENSLRLSRQSLRLLRLFEESFSRLDTESHK